MSSLPAENQRSSIFMRFGAKYGVNGNDVSRILKNTAFKIKDKEATDEQMAALLIVAEQFNLNPFVKEIYAFPDSNGRGIVPVVPVDGWARIANEHPQYDGVEFAYSEETYKHSGKECPAWIEAIVFRKDRSHPTKIREYLEECSRDTGPWKSHPRRMLRHKAFMQCCRVALSFANIYDEDEAQRIAEARVVDINDTMAAPIDVGSAPPLALTTGEQFETIILDLGIHDAQRREHVEVYIGECAKHFNASRDYVIEQIVRRPEEFVRTFPGWEQSYAKLRQQGQAQGKNSTPLPTTTPQADVNPVTGEVVTGEEQPAPHETAQRTRPTAEEMDTRRSTALEVWLQSGGTKEDAEKLVNNFAHKWTSAQCAKVEEAARRILAEKMQKAADEVFPTQPEGDSIPCPMEQGEQTYVTTCLKCPESNGCTEFKKYVASQQ